jgi:hypothetical protein
MDLIHIAVENAPVDDLCSNSCLVALSCLVGAIKRTSCMPYCLKFGVVVMVTKPGASSDALTDRRPITLLPELGKLVSRDLKQWFTQIFHERPEVLDNMQRAYHHDGSSRQCVRYLLDMCEDYMEACASVSNPDPELIFTAYDFSKAFDLIQPFSLEATCRRFNLPPAFTALILDMLSRTKA